MLRSPGNDTWQSRRRPVPRVKARERFLPRRPPSYSEDSGQNAALENRQIVLSGPAAGNQCRRDGKNIRLGLKRGRKNPRNRKDKEQGSEEQKSIGRPVESKPISFAA